MDQTVLFPANLKKIPFNNIHYFLPQPSKASKIIQPLRVSKTQKQGKLGKLRVGPIQHM